MMQPPIPPIGFNANGPEGSYYQQQQGQFNPWSPPHTQGLSGAASNERVRDSQSQVAAHNDHTGGPYGDEKAENPFEDVKV